jgi:hypothetical protein
MNQQRPANVQQHIAIIQNQIVELRTYVAELTKLTEERTRQIILREQKLQNDINDMKQFLKTRLGAPDASKLKDIMKNRLVQERFDYRG